jgi:transposase
MAFLGLAERGPFLRPGLTTPKAPARRRGQGWPQATARACAARSVLDGGEHGATLNQDGAGSGGPIMRDTFLLQQALGLTPPWTVSRSEFDSEAHRLDVQIDFAPGSRFACPVCDAADCPPHDTERTSWRHLNFFQHQAWLNARVPRVRCEHCGVKKIGVPWARPGSGFTLLFEAMTMTMVPAMPVKAVARMVGEHDTRLWRVIHHYVDEARANTDAAGVTKLAIDETSARRGQDYISLFVDIEQARVLSATDGKDAATVAAFAENLTAHGGDPAAIAEVCIDMSAAFIKGVSENLPDAAITFDKFHAVKIINDAVDKVRREEVKSRPELKKSRYVWLKNGNCPGGRIAGSGGAADSTTE